MTHTRAHLTPDFDEYLLLAGWSVYAQPDAQLSWLRVAENGIELTVPLFSGLLFSEHSHRVSEQETCGSKRVRAEPPSSFLELGPGAHSALNSHARLQQGIPPLF